MDPDRDRLATESESGMKRGVLTTSIRIAGVIAALGTGIGAVSLVQATTSGADPSSVSAKIGVGGDVPQDIFAAFGGASPAPPSGATSFYTPLHSSAAT